MKRLLRGRLGGLPGRARGTIRARLAVVLTLALAPVLFLGVIQSGLSFRREAVEQNEALQGAALRSAAGARARMESASILLETLAPGVVGLDCQRRLAEVKERIPGYANLIRFESTGRVACSADSAPADPERRNRPWFRDLFADQPMTVTSQPGARYADEPVILASVRAGPQSDGVLTAVIPLASLRPSLRDRALPDGADVALVDRTGAILSVTDRRAFPAIPARWVERSLGGEGYLAQEWAPDRLRRVYSIAPLVGQDVFVVLSAPSRGLISTAWLDPLSGLVFPLLAYIVALVAVMFAIDRVVLRWIVYLERVAAIYARGRLSVRPLQAEAAPQEIRDLAETLDAMASGILERDASLRETLSQKDGLLREIHHRVKNNLQVISSLLSMQERALTDTGARLAIYDTRQRITALSLVYRALYQGADIQHADLRPFLEDLTNQLMMADTTQGRVRLEVHAQPLIIDPDKLAPLALFAVEALTNAQKHGLAEAGGVLTLTFRVDGPEAILSIADDGGGRNPDPALLQAKGGVGRTLMNAFARQLRGRMEMEPNPEGGLTVTLIFPTPEALDRIDNPTPAGGTRS
ncbi:MAG: sensor histidine kinase [Caulobacter sp.]